MIQDLKSQCHRHETLKKKFERSNKTVWSVVAGAALALSSFTLLPLARAGETDKAQQVALVNALAQSKLTLVEGIRQAAKTGEVPISAKFEFDDGGKLSLSIYTAEKGLSGDAEHNVLKELSGSPEQKDWKPETEVFKDVAHVARASEQLTLLRLSRHSLVEILESAQKKHPGTVLAITPMVKAHQPVFVVLEAVGKDKVIELDYRLDGREVSPTLK